MLIHIFLYFCLFSSINPLNILVYSPGFAASHSNFLGKLADTLTEAGHNVTYLIPVVEVSKRDECIGVKLTKDLVIVEAGEEMLAQKQDNLPESEIMDIYWKAEMDSSNSRDIFKYYSNSMQLACRNFLSNSKIFEKMKSKHFDVAILEPIHACGLGFVKKLGIEKTILASSCSFFDSILPYIGEPLDFSYVPSLFSVSGEKMEMMERWENYMVAKEINIALEEMYDAETQIYRTHLGNDLPDWRELLPSASLFFTNSNPYLDFPRPVLQKTIAIGGISVNLEWIKEQKLDEKWDEILGKREKNVLISFGSMVKAMYMPEKWRNGLLSAIKSFPNVTFIWKYESDDVTFAESFDNIHLSKWVPQTGLLNDKRLNAFMTHGGLGSTNELAFLGKLSIMIPVFADQDRNARMLERHGGVILLKKRDLENDAIIRNSIQNILFHEKFKRNSEKLADILRNQPMKPKEQVVKYTEFVAKHGPFPQMDPYGRHLNYFQKAFLDIYTLFTIFYITVLMVTVVFVRFIFGKLRKI